VLSRKTTSDPRDIEGTLAVRVVFVATMASLMLAEALRK